MRILITADLHYNMKRSREPAEHLARQACAAGGDVLVLVGDTAGAQNEPWRQCLDLFADFAGVKLLVPGNHCLWCVGDEDSMHRYRKVLPAIAGEAGFKVLDNKPAIVDNVGLVGSVGWYDYSFRDESLGIPEAFYRAKISPGAAVSLGREGELLKQYEHQLTEEHYSVGARWMDGVHVKLGMTDEQFVMLLVNQLADQLEELSAEAQRIVAFIHHLPFEQLVPRNHMEEFAFAAAFMGAGRFGEILQNCPKLTHVYCGHSHHHVSRRIGHLKVINVGSTYTEKRLEILEI